MWNGTYDICEESLGVNKVGVIVLKDDQNSDSTLC